MIRIEGKWFKDELGRTLMLRGVNLGGSSKLPYCMPGATGTTPGASYIYTYVARATTPGTFVVPPPKAEEMYSPEVFGRGATERMIIEWPHAAVTLTRAPSAFYREGACIWRAERATLQ